MYWFVDDAIMSPCILHLQADALPRLSGDVFAKLSA
jgi:hypothetical protein